MRLHTQTAMIENGFVHLPNAAPWLAQYLHEQGLIDRKVTVEELFHPSMFEISKV